MSRTVSLVLVSRAGEPLGRLPAFDVDVPYWQEVASVVRGARERFGVPVTVLRLLGGDRDVPVGGSVTYLAEALPGAASAVPAPAAPAIVPRPPASVPRPRAGVPRPRADLDMSDHPDRCDYARPGGPAASLDWAASVLGPDGVVGAEQQRTWNLSAIWRLDTGRGPVWLKQVPRFFAHEPVVLAHLAAAGYGAVAPRLIAADGGRMLLDHVPGDDLYGADAETRRAIAADMHAIQVSTLSTVDTLVSAGVPDRRAAPLCAAIRAVVSAHGGGDPRLAELVAGLDDRLVAIAACRVPDTLVHGDLHPGNVRGGAGPRVLIDWGDSFVGHPGFDILRLTEDCAEAPELLSAWCSWWRAAVPGCDPDGALALLRPVAALRNATAYADFLANIEPTEHPYHAADVGHWLKAAADLAG